jgi:sterol desaturase/sphingolipid hydroxylase (fatty acid hydroxylase superfamily)
VHHAINEGYLDKNFGGVLIICDKLFGTFAEETNDKICKYGIIGQIKSNNPITITFHQWHYLAKTMLTAKGVKLKLKVLFGYPTSSVKNK